MQKTHHAAVDGATMFEIISAVHDRTPDSDPPPPIDDWRPERTPSSWQLLSRAGVNSVVRPFHSLQTLARSQALSIRRELGVSRASPAPRTRFSGAVSGHLVVDARRFALDDLKRIKASVDGATINDAAITIVGGALRKYLSGKGELPEESLRVMAPISLRSPAKSRPVATRCRR
jgi:hypothetical protein